MYIKQLLLVGNVSGQIKIKITIFGINNFSNNEIKRIYECYYSNIIHLLNIKLQYKLNFNITNIKIFCIRSLSSKKILFTSNYQEIAKTNILKANIRNLKNTKQILEKIKYT